jgi:hypothetical protein
MLLHSIKGTPELLSIRTPHIDVSVARTLTPTCSVADGREAKTVREDARSVTIATHGVLFARPLQIGGLKLESSDGVFEALSLLATLPGISQKGWEDKHKILIETKEIIATADVLYQEIRTNQRLTSLVSNKLRLMLEDWKSDLYRSALVAGVVATDLLNERTRHFFELGLRDISLLTGSGLPSISSGEALVLSQAFKDRGVHLEPWHIRKVRNKWVALDLQNHPFVRGAVRERLHEIAQEHGIDNETSVAGFRALLPHLKGSAVRFRSQGHPKGDLAVAIAHTSKAACFAIEDVVLHHPDFTAVRRKGFCAADCPELPQYFWRTEIGAPSAHALQDVEKAYLAIAKEEQVAAPLTPEGLAELHSKCTTRRFFRTQISFWGRTATSALREGYAYSAKDALEALVREHAAELKQSSCFGLASPYPRVPNGTWQSRGVTSEHSKEAVTRMCQALAEENGITLEKASDLQKLLPYLVRDKLRASKNTEIAKGREALRRGFFGDKAAALREVAQRLNFVTPGDQTTDAL